MLNDPPKDHWKEYNSTSPLVSFFKKNYPISKEIEDILNRETFPVYVKKNKFIISPLDRNLNVYLILKGFVRGYVKVEGVELTTWLATESDIIGTIDSFMTDKGSREFVQAIDDVELVALPHTVTNYLYENYNEANIVGRIIMEQYYCSAEERAFIIRLPSAIAKYKRFLKSYPGIVNRISLKYIASFLGLRLETLSRVRSKI